MLAQPPPAGTARWARPRPRRCAPGRIEKPVANISVSAIRRAPAAAAWAIRGLTCARVAPASSQTMSCWTAATFTGDHLPAAAAPRPVPPVACRRRTARSGRLPPSRRTRCSGSRRHRAAGQVAAERRRHRPDVHGREVGGLRGARRRSRVRSVRRTAGRAVLCRRGASDRDVTGQGLRDRGLERRAVDVGQELLHRADAVSRSGRRAQPADLPAGDAERLARRWRSSPCVRPCPGQGGDGTCARPSKVRCS